MRRTGRVLLLGDANRVLLVGSVNPDPAGPQIWVPPGGGGEGTEDQRAAAARCT